MPRRLAVLAVLCLAVPALADEPPIKVTNLDDGTTLRHPVALLRGALADTKETGISCVNTTSGRPDARTKGVADGGRFLVLTELVPGDNKLLLKAGAAEHKLTLRYKPQTNPYVVHVIYMTDNSGATESGPASPAAQASASLILKAISMAASR